MAGRNPQKNARTKQRNEVKQNRKRNEAIERNLKTSQLSCNERVAKLDKKLGVGVGAKKERNRLAKLIQNIS